MILWFLSTQDTVHFVGDVEIEKPLFFTSLRHVAVLTHDVKPSEARSFAERRLGSIVCLAGSFYREHSHLGIKLSLS